MTTHVVDALNSAPIDALDYEDSVSDNIMFGVEPVATVFENVGLVRTTTRTMYRVGVILHRIGGPAVEYSDGTQEWWLGGKRHRIDGPAVVRADGTHEWWVAGKRQRLDGPAIIGPNGQAWYVAGKLHRADGPAVIRSTGRREWFTNGRRTLVEAG